ncbi:NAD(P)H dehydrogenase (quinone) [Pustulibacterium marinum]|uniref:NAD(P)H dehydrogenase (Quinone) n=1 Tax=Pustulibacterium marinum TaxID=1224947 RepID=A0A1I7I9K2_9FLAO|nr:flavodoxin family protein [Pustulibacterium marinum]SFU69588.1 NAD(P)H dehydrogenase (quinone) [Pustulibacterium marinum]
MKKVAIVYYSGTGHTEKLAEAIEKGANSVEGVEANLIAINPSDIINGSYKNQHVIDQLDESDAIIFGSPTYMGGVSAQFKALADATSYSWINQKWKNKLAAGFTVSGAKSGDKLHTLQYFNLFAMQHGMIWVSLGELPGQSNGINNLGSWIGVMAVAQNEDPSITPSIEDKNTAEILGHRVATLALAYQL